MRFGDLSVLITVKRNLATVDRYEYMSLEYERFSYSSSAFGINKGSVQFHWQSIKALKLCTKESGVYIRMNLFFCRKFQWKSEEVEEQF
jgi:hypothetical protein